uniref:DNA polymerase n=1 Tax=viral metagenome TaxID=1070528 RepID=A0A6M3KJZ6_9ZZZZ
MKYMKKDLLKAFEAVRPGLAPKEIEEQFQHFLFTGTDLITYRGNICIHYPFETDFFCSVKAKEIIKQISKDSTQDYVEIVLEGDILRIFNKKQKTNVATHQGEAIIKSIEEIQSQMGDWQTAPEDFLNGLFLCMFSTTKDETLGRLTCLRCEGNEVYSSDSVRGSKYRMKGNVTEKGDHFLIKASVVRYLNLFKVSEFCRSKGWIHFKTPQNAVFSTSLIEGDIPQSSFLNAGTVGTCIKLAGKEAEIMEDLDALTEVSAGEMEYDKTTIVTITKNLWSMYGIKEGINSTRDTEIEYDGKDITFGINPSFLLQVLKTATTLYVSDYIFLQSGPFDHILALKDTYV